MEFLIITGLSGGGKSRVADVCEDLDYYCVDNLPAAMVPRFGELCCSSAERFSRVALVMDSRTVRDGEEIRQAVEQLQALGATCRLLYVEASPLAIINRYRESRRPHPLEGAGGDVAEAVRREAALFLPLKERADFVLDTTGLSLNQLHEAVRSLLGSSREYFAVNLMSFGYKNGVPPQADLVFDVRCLPNPFYVESLREKTGLDEAVADYIFEHEEARVYLEKLSDLLAFSLPLYAGEGRHRLNVAVGCTGGHHRSVAVAERLGAALSGAGFVVRVTHRDIQK